MSTPEPCPPKARLAASGWTLPRVLAAVAGLLLIAMWISSGSLVMALLVLALVAGTVALGVVVHTWVLRGPRPAGDELPDTHPTADLDHVPGPADRVRRALRGLLARPWVRGDALVRAATTRLASADALVFTPRGQRVAAPHLWVEWNTADLAEVAGRWPLDVLARELVDGYVEHARQHGVRRLADRTWLHLLAGPDVPVGRVVVTAAFSRPQRAPTASACVPDGDGPEGAVPAHHRARVAPSAPPPAPVARPRLAAPRGVPRIAGDETTTITTNRLTTNQHEPLGVQPSSAGGATSVVPRPGPGPHESGSLWRRVLPALKTIRAPRRPPRPPGPETVGVLVAETPGARDVVLGGDRGAIVVVGRDPHADAVVGDPGVSWRHLTVTRRHATTWLVADAGSTNGTMVDGRRIGTPTPLRAGGVVGLGPDGPSYRLALRSTDPERRTGPDAGGRHPDRTRVEVT